MKFKMALKKIINGIRLIIIGIFIGVIIGIYVVEPQIFQNILNWLSSICVS